MGRRMMAAALALGIVAALATPALAKARHQGRMKQYTHEHGARMHRHHTRTPAQRHARMQRYSAEHRARQHRHRAHMKSQ